jgi:replicative DNA helicase
MAKRPVEDEPGLPRNLEAERATLGAALLNQAAADYLADHLAVESYYRQAHQVLFRAVQALRHTGREVDLVTLKQQLGAKGLEEVGGAAYVTRLADGTVSGHYADYAAVLEDLRTKRALAAYAKRLQEAIGTAGQSGASLLLDADKRLLELQAGHLNGRHAALADSVPMLIEDLDYRAQHQGQLTGLETGFPSVNDLTFGWQAGDMVIVAARPSIGKTTFALNTAWTAACTGARVAFFSLEMKRRQLEYRLLSYVSGIPLARLLSGYINEADGPGLHTALEALKQVRIEVDDATGRTAWEMRSACRRWKADGGLDLVVVDYVQLMPGTLDKRGASRNEEVTDISRRLKTLADEAGVPVLALSQLSRPTEGRSDPRPKLTDLRESGALEQDADLVCFLHRKQHKEGGPTEFILEKQRNGPTGTVMLTLDRDTVTFTDGGDPLLEQTAAEKQEARKAKQVSFFKQRRRG